MKPAVPVVLFVLGTFLVIFPLAISIGAPARETIPPIVACIIVFGPVLLGVAMIGFGIYFGFKHYTN